MQVWSWDITMLPGPYRGINYCLYAVLDVFSRKIVAWRVEDAEVDELAAQMFRDALKHGPRPWLLHSDRGASMTSHILAATMAELGIQQSRNRPRVSNDNPFSEAWFKTAKYQPDYPGYFHDLEHARTWAAQTIDPTTTSTATHPWPDTPPPASTTAPGYTSTRRRQATLDQLHRKPQPLPTPTASPHPRDQRRPQPTPTHRPTPNRLTGSVPSPIQRGFWIADLATTR